MSVVLTEPIRTLLRAPFGFERARLRVGEALWLYVYVVSHAMKTGQVVRSREHLAHELGAEEATVDRWIATLVDTRLLTLQSQAPYLVIKLCFWPGSGSGSVEDVRGIQPVAASHKDLDSSVPVGSSLLVPAGKAKAGSAGKQGVDRGPGEGEGLLAEAQAVLALADVAPLRGLLATHPPPRIRDALARVSRTPLRQIRKSRFALFRYLLVHSSTPHDYDPPQQP